jgi:hypothetical protein
LPELFNLGGHLLEALTLGHTFEGSIEHTQQLERATPRAATFMALAGIALRFPLATFRASFCSHNAEKKEPGGVETV